MLTRIYGRRSGLSNIGLIVMMLVAFTQLFPLTTVQAATCGGNIVYWTTDNYEGHNAIFVNTQNTFPISRIEYWNGSAYELVRNGGDGVDYDHPLGRSGNDFVFGVSRGWTWSHWDWRDASRWRVWYNC